MIPAKIRYEGGTVGTEDAVRNIPDDFILFQNYPNPFNPATTIEYSIPNGVNSEKPALAKPGGAGSIVNLKVYDILGREVVTLINAQQSPGQYSVTWDASGFPAGIYFYTLSTAGFMETKKMILLK